ncbi:hypothetical protein F4806DRAFT_477725 [Annulohypoxylon nitens]|nr:hypothetical protein F4806DRAFT_477725 [Annulohypoxylon nitens]
MKCITSKRACTGYGRNLVFINRTPSTPLTTATSVLSSLRAQHQPKAILANGSIQADLHRLFSESPHKSQEFRKYAVELLQATYLPKPPFSSSFNVDTIEGSFSWVYRLADLTKPSKYFLYALREMAGAFTRAASQRSYDYVIQEWQAL